MARVFLSPKAVPRLDHEHWVAFGHRAGHSLKDEGAQVCEVRWQPLIRGGRGDLWAGKAPRERQPEALLIVLEDGTVLEQPCEVGLFELYLYYEVEEGETVVFPCGEPDRRGYSERYRTHFVSFKTDRFSFDGRAMELRREYGYVPLLRFELTN